MCSCVELLGERGYSHSSNIKLWKRMQPGDYYIKVIWHRNCCSLKAMNQFNVILDASVKNHFGVKILCGMGKRVCLNVIISSRSAFRPLVIMVHAHLVPPNDLRSKTRKHCSSQHLALFTKITGVWYYSLLSMWRTLITSTHYFSWNLCR